MRIYEELKEWRFQLSYYDNAKPGEKCPTPKGVKRYIDKILIRTLIARCRNVELIEENHELKIKIEKLQNK